MDVAVTTLFVLGGGTLGRFICDIVHDCVDLRIGGIFDDRFPAVTAVDGYPIVGRFADVNPAMHRHLAIGVGDPAARRRLFEAHAAAGCAFPAVVHPTVVIAPSAAIADGTVVGPHSTVLGGSRLRDGACLLSHVNVNQDVAIGKWCLVGAAVAIGNGAALEDGCHVAMGQVIKPGAIVAAWTYAN